MKQTSITLAALLVTFVNANYIDFEVQFDSNGRGFYLVQPYAFEETVKEMFEKIIAQLAKRDPLLIPSVDYDVGDERIYVKLQIEDLMIRGFSSIKLTEIKINILRMSARFRVEFDSLQFVTPNYKLDGRFIFVPIYGSGSFNLKVVGLGLAGTAKVHLASSSIKDLGLAFSVNQTNVVLTGFLDNEPLSNIISTAITIWGPKIINNYGKRFGHLLSGIIKDLLNELLNPNPIPEPTSTDATPEPETESEPRPERKPEPKTYRIRQLRL